MTNRRSVLQSGLAALASLPAAGFAQSTQGPGGASLPVDPVPPEVAEPETTSAAPPVDLPRYIKLIGSLVQEAVYTAFEGVLWGLLPGQTPVPLCGFHTLARHQWTPREDGSYLQQRFELGYFSALDAQVPAATLNNPISPQGAGEEVEPFHYRRGGGQRLFTPSGRSMLQGDGTSGPERPLELDWRNLAGNTWLTEQHTSEYTAPFAPELWPRESAGNRYFFGSETTYSARTAQLDNPAIRSAEQQLYWSSVASWEPWLLMGDTPGFVLWRGVGAKLGSPLDAPEALRNYALGKEPRYFAPGVPWVGQKSAAEEYQQERKPVPVAPQAPVVDSPQPT